MAFKMSENSLFAMLLRASWWYSALIALAIIALCFSFLSGQYLIVGLFASTPFIGIAGYVGFKQLQRPSQKRMQEVQDEARQMRSTEIAQKIAGVYTESRYDSSTFKGNAADLELVRGNKKILLSSKRFKAGSTGVEPLKQLVAAGEHAEATSYLYVALGGVSAAAFEFANKHDIEIIQAARLAEIFDGKAVIE